MATKRPTTKAELIEAYGAEWYERYKEKQRTKIKERYHRDVVKSRQRSAENYQRNKPTFDARRKGNDVYRINVRDRNRLLRMGLIKDGIVVHHLKYHSDNKDKSWIDDVMLLTREEHVLWHKEHADFVANENVIY